MESEEGSREDTVRVVGCRGQGKRPKGAPVPLCLATRTVSLLVLLGHTLLELLLLLGSSLGAGGVGGQLLGALLGGEELLRRALVLRLLQRLLRSRQRAGSRGDGQQGDACWGGRGASGAGLENSFWCHDLAKDSPPNTAAANARRPVSGAALARTTTAERRDTARAWCATGRVV